MTMVLLCNTQYIALGETNAIHCTKAVTRGVFEMFFTFYLRDSTQQPETNYFNTASQERSSKLHSYKNGGEGG